MFSKLERVDEVADAFREATNFNPEIELFYKGLPNRSSLESLENWLRQGVENSKEDDEHIKDLFLEDKVLVVGCLRRDKPDHNNCFVGVGISFNTKDGSINVLGRFANDPLITEISLDDNCYGISWTILGRNNESKE